MKTDNLVKLLNGLSLLDNRDKERIISVVYALNFAKSKAEKAYASNETLGDSCEMLQI